MTEHDETGGDSLEFLCPGCDQPVEVPVGRQVVICPRCREGHEVADAEEAWDEGGGEVGRVAESRFRSTEEVADPNVQEFVDEDGRLMRRRRVKKRRRKAPEVGHTDWERKKSDQPSRKPVVWGVTLVALVLLLVTLVVVLVTSFFLEVSPGRGEPIATNRGPSVLPNPDEDEPDGGACYEVALNDVEEVVRKFLSAPSVEEMSLLVRDRERVLPLIREYYARDGVAWQPQTCKDIAEDADVSFKATMRAVLVTQDDYSLREIGVEETEDGFLVDWESWVAYSEMSWEEFRRQKPTRPILCRVRLSRDSYYNFAFTDESQWMSFRIVTPEDETLWGYAPEATAPAKLKTWHVGSTEKLAIVRLRFPEEAERDDQVVIDDLVVDGWVLHPGAFSPAP